MRLDADTKVHDLLTQHPFLEDFLAGKSPKFEMLRNRMARATIGRVATLRTAAGIASLDLRQLLESLALEIERHRGARPETDLGSGAVVLTRGQRLQALQSIIRDLHDGGDLGRARAKFSEAVGDVEATEIAAMEDELIRGGLPVSEVQRLCDVHVGAFREALDQHPDLDTPAGHPVHTYVAENRVIARLASQVGAFAREAAAGKEVEANLSRAAAVLRLLGGIESHYRRKENQLFPMLERHGVTGPSQVMWGVQDEIRATLKQAQQAADRKDAPAFGTLGAALARDLNEMVFKEEKILFPMALQTLSEAEWSEVRRGEDELGYAFARPVAVWPAASAAAATQPAAREALLALMTGALSLEQVNLVFTHLPVDLSFVDEHDTVRFYSEGPHRIFPRSPAAIGRKVQLCHPPKSLHVVQSILDSFRAGTQSVAEFWIEMQGRFIHIRYLALRDGTGTYRGCLEVTQDVTEIRQLQGERRLLAWDGVPSTAPVGAHAAPAAEPLAN